ncbi:hypothetical protein TRIP_D310072 [uncultured Paludibacter sp.]|nr:hypothetical protein TRIP_D310072 [uncultured Paludibacter sp.]
MSYFYWGIPGFVKNKKQVRDEEKSPKIFVKDEIKCRNRRTWLFIKI